MKEVKNMKFHKQVPSEVRGLLTEQLRQYEKEMIMTSEERKELHKWVASGRSPYDNGDYICTEGGFPLDFISALRFETEQREWYQSLSEKEKKELTSDAAEYSTKTEEVMVKGSNYYQTDPDEELPFK